MVLAFNRMRGGGTHRATSKKTSGLMVSQTLSTACTMSCPKYVAASVHLHFASPSSTLLSQRLQRDRFCGTVSTACLLVGVQDGKPTYVILDNAAAMNQTSTLSPLLRLRELTNGLNIGIVIIANMGWEALSARCFTERPPLPVYFRAYEEHEIIQVSHQGSCARTCTTTIGLQYFRSTHKVILLLC